jgi:hypothetical protein
LTQLLNFCIGGEISAVRNAAVQTVVVFAELFGDDHPSAATQLQTAAVRAFFENPDLLFVLGDVIDAVRSSDAIFLNFCLFWLSC